MKFVLVLLLLLNVDCVGMGSFHHIGGAAHYSALSNDAEEVSIVERHNLKECGAELLGTLEGIDLKIIPYMVARKGGTHFVMFDHTAEVWNAKDKVCIERAVK